MTVINKLTQLLSSMLAFENEEIKTKVEELKAGILEQVRKAGTISRVGVATRFQDLLARLEDISCTYRDDIIDGVLEILVDEKSIEVTPNTPESVMVTWRRTLPAQILKPASAEGFLSEEEQFQKTILDLFNVKPFQTFDWIFQNIANREYSISDLTQIRTRDRIGEFMRKQVLAGNFVEDGEGWTKLPTDTSDIKMAKEVLDTAIVKLFREKSEWSYDQIHNKIAEKIAPISNMENSSFSEVVQEAMMRLKEKGELVVSNKGWRSAYPLGHEEFPYTPHPTLPEVDKTAELQEQLKQALEIIALNFLADHINSLESGLQVGTVPATTTLYKRIRGLILDHGLEFRLAKVKEGEFGIPVQVCRAQLVKTLYPVDADLLNSISSLFYNSGY